MEVKHSECCRFCGGPHLSMFLSLGEQPPSNSFIRKEDIGREVWAPLDVYFCHSCSLVQLRDVVPAEYIFSDYLYLSSSSKALKLHYAALCEDLTRRLSLRPADLVVDIGCNDGILLHGYALPGLRKLGVEPSSVAEIALASGLDVQKAFFTSDLGAQIAQSYGRAAVITATNVFAHVDEIKDFVAGVAALLDRYRGVFVIEAPYLIDMMELKLFDTIYHEHLCYLSLTPVMPLLHTAELEVFFVERVPFGASGPAIRIYAQHRGARHPVDAAVTQMLDQEMHWGVGNFDRYKCFSSEIEVLKLKTLELLRKLSSSGVRIGGYGAPAKGNTLLNSYGLGPEIIRCIAETNVLKQGLLTPGSHIPIVSEDEFLRDTPEYALLLTWNYLDFFLANSRYIKQGGRFIVPLPDVRISPL